jgi:peptidoglycan/LPS O-acetylase OafA/YrhL
MSTSWLNSETPWVIRPVASPGVTRHHRAAAPRVPQPTRGTIVAGDNVDTGATAADRPPEAPRFISNADKLGYAPPLDGMRGLGVMLVVLVHASFVAFASFAATVDMFFVVSGFLITTLLLEEDRRSGRVNLKQFYSRRVLRLFPLMYTVLVLTLLAFLAVHLMFDERELLDKAISDVLAGGTYMYHVVHPVHVELVGGGPAPIRPLVQLWSLTVEEHFYLFGVLIVIFVVKRRWVTPLMILFTTAWIAIGIARLGGHVGPRFAWYQRPDALLLGVVLAFVNARMSPTWSAVAEKWWRRAATVAVVICSLVVASGMFIAKPLGLYVPFLVPEGGSLHDGLYWGEYGFTLVSACVAVMVLTFVRCPDHWAARILSFKLFTFMGVRSYAIYLIHVPLGVLLVETVGRKSEGLALLLYLPLLAVTTEMAHRLVEKPAMQLKTRLAAPNASGTSGRHS